jgi:phage tail protein X
MRHDALRIEMRAGLIGVLAALALSGCGAAGIGAGPASSASPSNGPGTTFDLAVNEKSSTASMRVGQKLEAVLHARAGMAAWSGVHSSDTSVLTPIVNPAATAVRGVTLAAFQALAPGKAEITATAGADCSPGKACPQFLMVLTITVTVVAA